MSHRSVTAMLQIVLFSSLMFLARCSSSLYPHSYFDSMSEGCRESSSCSGNASTTFSIKRNCQCDTQCATYGDCCQDSPLFKPSPLQNCVTAGDWNTAGDFRDNYYMVTSCPSSWTDEITRSRCEKYKETIRDEPLLGHPVTSNATNITYANYHCASCNGDLRINTVIRWKFAVTCDASLTLPVPDVDAVIKDSRYGEDFKFVPRFANSSYHTCKLYVWRPFSLLRRCHKNTVVTCPPSWQNETVRAQCQAYTSLVFWLKKRPYRNPHCATCSNVADRLMDCVVANRCLYCEKYSRKVPRIFQQIFDFSDKCSNVVGQKCLCPNKNEIYDPNAKKCVDIYLSIAGQNGDYGLDNCYGNISSGNINNSLIFIFKREEYVLNDDFTVTVLNDSYTMMVPNDNSTVTVLPRKKLYGNGEFRIKEDGSLELCAEYKTMEENFNAFIRYLTFLGLGVSIGCLFLHLVAFAKNPALRNLSDKSLASLCTALILAYGAFFIGQLLKVGGLACKVTAVVTYYSFLSSFAWLLLIAFEIWRALRLSVTRLRILSGQSRRHAFITYSALAWLIFPVILVSAALSMEYRHVDPTFQPGFGVHNCWFGNRKALFVFFAIPVGVTMMLNVCFFASTAHTICTNKISPCNKSASTRRNYKLYARLCLLMGLTWIVGLVAGYLDLEAVWYIFVALNAFQGLFIFLAFTCTKKARGRYRTQDSGETTTNYVDSSTSCWSQSCNKTSHTEKSTSSFLSRQNAPCVLAVTEATTTENM